MLIVMAVIVSTTWIVLSGVAILIVRRRTKVARGTTPIGVTILKPLKGVDAELDENLASFFRQDHANFEIVFGVCDADDPAVLRVRRGMAKHPTVRAKLVVHRGAEALNPKVSNLLGMIEHASNDVVIISDSNIRVRPDYAREMAAALDDARVGLVTSLVVGDGERSLGAALDNAQMNSFVTPGAALPTLVGNATVVGKSMAFRQSTLSAQGGLATCKDLLAEDYIIGKIFESAGYEVRVAPTPVLQVGIRMSVGQFFARHVRWSVIRNRLVPAMWLFEPLTNPAFALVLGVATGMVWPMAIWAFALCAARDIVFPRLLGREIGWLALVGIVRDALSLGVWLATPFYRHVNWRGCRVRIAAGTRLFREQSAFKPVA
ncbi:MAG: glycosyltransferase [Deltaproteobacteria bacterium]|nr:glycosyltransferase [Deltaproteobacteria bacterium]